MLRLVLYNPTITLRILSPQFCVANLWTELTAQDWQQTVGDGKECRKRQRERYQELAEKIEKDTVDTILLRQLEAPSKQN